jgi:hypothetical protein
MRTKICNSKNDKKATTRFRGTTRFRLLRVKGPLVATRRQVPLLLWFVARKTYRTIFRAGIINIPVVAQNITMWQVANCVPNTYYWLAAVVLAANKLAE